MCPRKKYAQFTNETAFLPRHGLADSDLVTLFNWSEAEFLANTEGSAIRRTGYDGWLRNLAVGLGNAPSDAVSLQRASLKRASLKRASLKHPGKKCPLVSARVQEHID